SGSHDVAVTNSFGFLFLRHLKLALVSPACEPELGGFANTPKVLTARIVHGSFALTTAVVCVVLRLNAIPKDKSGKTCRHGGPSRPDIRHTGHVPKVYVHEVPLHLDLYRSWLC
ncbi:unnamed protein product, partial [Ectocarpus sp. 12 AP-2014]